MGQYWILRDMDARTTSALGKLGESFFDMGESLHEALCRVPIPSFTLHPQVRPDVPAMFRLAMTCRQCSRAGEPVLRRVLFEHFAPSAGHRLLCVGDGVKPGDYPLTLELSDGELQELNGTVEDEEYIDEECDATLYNIIPTKDHVTNRGIKDALRSKIGPYLWPALYSTVSKIVPDQPCPCDTSFVLRNLSQRQYVRGEAMDEFCQKMAFGANNSRKDRPRLGDAAMARICWSSDCSTSLNYDGPIEVHRGVWAGNRLDIVPSEAFLADCKDDAQAWVDVSAEVIAEVEAIWVAERMLKRRD
ncbi:hypothetical protein HDZ31DRAFT_18717, partial [Schizophyllum fasciatum]